MTYNVALETIATVNSVNGSSVSVAHTILEFENISGADYYILHYDRNEKSGYVTITRTATRLY